MIGNLAFDHVWQALFFTGCGFILAEVVARLFDAASTKEAGKVQTATLPAPPALPDSPATTAR